MKEKGGRGEMWGRRRRGSGREEEEGGYVLTVGLEVVED